MVQDCVVVVTDRHLDILQPHEVTSELYIVGGVRPSHIRDRSVLGIGGSGRFGRRLVYDVHEAGVALGEAGSIAWASLGEQIYGSLCVYVWDRSRQELGILPDPLGSAVVFTYEGHGVTCYSTNIGMLVDVLSRIGITLVKSVRYAAALVITGSGGAVPASYDGVNVLEMGEHVLVSSGKANHAFYPSTLAIGQPVDYAAAHGAIAEDVASNIAAAANSDHDLKISHLTGGYDSRLVLAALRAARKEHLFFYHCLKTPRVDRDVAEGLAKTFGLTMTEYSGVDSAAVYETVEDIILAPYRFSSGMFINGPRTGQVGGATLVLQGGYGGLARTFMKRDLSEVVLDPDPNRFANTYWRGYGFDTTDDESLFSRDFQNELAESARRVIQRGAERGVRRDALTDFYFLSVRNRYWIAMQSMLQSRVISQFDPLYSVNIPATALSLKFSERRSNIVALDLMEHLEPSLLSYPFAYDTPFNWEYQQLRSLPEEKPFDASRSLYILPPGNVRRAPRVPHAVAKLPEPTAHQKARAHQLRQPDSRIVRYDYSVSRLNSALEEAKGKAPAISEIINEKAVDRLQREEPRGGGEVQAVSTLYATLRWLVE